MFYFNQNSDHAIFYINCITIRYAFKILIIHIQSYLFIANFEVLVYH